MTESPFVFLDPQGRRWLRFKIMLAFCAFIVTILCSIFFAALSIKPELELPEEVTSLKLHIQAERDKVGTNTNLKGIKDAHTINKFLGNLPLSETLQEHEANHEKIVAGFLAPWDNASLASFQKHKNQLTHVVADWFELTLSDADNSLQLVEPQDDDDKVDDITVENHLKLILVIGNYKDQRFYPEAVEGLLKSPTAEQEAFFVDVFERVKRLNGSGILLDWNEIDPTYQKEMTALLTLASDIAHQRDMELWLGIPLDLNIKLFDISAISPHIDRFVTLLHDENAETDEPGPIASTQWLNSWLVTLKKYVALSKAPQKWLASLGSYGYDWSAGHAKMVGFADVMTMLRLAGLEQSKLGLHKEYENLTFAYKGNQTTHNVWFLDAITFYNQLKTVEKIFTGGIVIHRLGTEDAGVWKILEQRQIQLQGKPQDTIDTLSEMLSEITLDIFVPSIGNGNILTLTEQPYRVGYRKVNVVNNGFLQEEYQQFPEGPVITRSFMTAKDQVVITFDDGPNPEWTPAILDILKEKQAKAVFFVLGANAERHPKLIKRIVEEGHEIGSHTYTHPELNSVSNERGVLELNATQRLIQHLTGRSTLLFRPPYNTQQGPVVSNQLQPLHLANSLGYVVVSQDIDPEDYTMPKADEILSKIMTQRLQGGSIILMHDAGGDRSQTVEALPNVIDYLRMRGDSISSISEVMRIKPEALMPPLKESRFSQFFSMIISGNAFKALHLVQSAIWIFLAIAACLLMARTGAIILFATAMASRDRKTTTKDNIFLSPVSVVIPAYNEEKVIEATVRSVLASHFPDDLEVIVIDDGSKDNTSKIVEKLSYEDKRVRLITQTNQGKAHALKVGIEKAIHSIIITLDADTLFLPDTIVNLIQPLADQRVGSVSGNAKVGNKHTWIGRFQAIEYVCGFNLEKMAYAALDCITVAPGAISALRKEAIIKADGIQDDTLAEDTDLTLAMHKVGYKIAYSPDAIALTEAPEKTSNLIKQRVRWAFGTMQCLSKHYTLLFSKQKKALGWFAIPGAWFFQVFLSALTPILDIYFLWSMATGAMTFALAFYFWAFMFMDIAITATGIWLEPTPRDFKQILYVIPMRFYYRTVLSIAIWKALLNVIKGVWASWGKLDRTGSATSSAITAHKQAHQA